MDSTTDQPRPQAQTPTTMPAAPSRRPVSLPERYGLVGLTVLLVVVFSVLASGSFPTLANARFVATNQSAVAVAALALLFPLSAGRFDILVGAVVGLSAIATAAAMSDYHLNLVAALVIGIGVGTLTGVLNGLLVAYLGVDSIVCTIGTATIIGGIITAYTKGIPIASGLSPTLTDLSVTSFLGVPVLFVIMMLIAVACGVVLRQTVYGRNLRSVGSNETAAVLVGLDVRRIVMLSFVGSGSLGGVAGVLYVAGYSSASPEVGGLQFLLPAFAAVFLGATALHPGSYNVPGTVSRCSSWRRRSVG